MRKIANTTELQSELQSILAYAQTSQPSRTVLARELGALSRRVAGNTFRVGDTVTLKKAIPGHKENGFGAGDKVRVTKFYKSSSGTSMVELRSGKGNVVTTDADSVDSD